MTRRGFWKKLGIFAGASVIPTKMLPNVSSKYPVIIDKLTKLQLWRSGFSVDAWTVAEEMELDFGPLPRSLIKRISKNIDRSLICLEVTNKAMIRQFYELERLKYK